MPTMKAIMKPEIEKSISQLLQTTQVLPFNNIYKNMGFHPMPVVM
jgi:uncharacterized Rossmann fold enzyme